MTRETKTSKVSTPYLNDEPQKPFLHAFFATQPPITNRSSPQIGNPSKLGVENDERATNFQVSTPCHHEDPQKLLLPMFFTRQVPISYQTSLKFRT